MLLYSLYILLSPLIWIALILSSFFNSKIRNKLVNQRESISLATKKILKDKGGREVIIIHAASAGEYEQTKPIIKKIDREKFFILQTFSSPTIFDSAKEDQLFDACCYLPFDFFLSTFTFLRATRATHFINTRHDVWPNSIICCRMLKIRSVLVNANLHSGSMKTKPVARGFFKFIYGELDLIVCPSSRVEKTFNQIGIKKNLIVISDTRINQIVNRSRSNPKNMFKENILDSTNIVFGSIDMTDINVIVKSMLDLYPNRNLDMKNKKQRVIIVPHECDEKSINEIMQPLEKSCFSFSFFKPQMDLNNFDIIIVNKTGILADIYYCSSLAYVGGGFTTGVHNVIEPLVYYNEVCFGPNTSLLDEAVDLVEANLGSVVSNSDDLFNIMKNLQPRSDSNQFDDEIEAFFKRSNNNINLIINKIFSNE